MGTPNIMVLPMKVRTWGFVEIKCMQREDVWHCLELSQVTNSANFSYGQPEKQKHC